MQKRTGCHVQRAGVAKVNNECNNVQFDLLSNIYKLFILRKKSANFFLAVVFCGFHCGIDVCAKKSLVLGEQT